MLLSRITKAIRPRINRIRSFSEGSSGGMSEAKKTLAVLGGLKKINEKSMKE